MISRLIDDPAAPGMKMGSDMLDFIVQLPSRLSVTRSPLQRGGGRGVTGKQLRCG